MDAFTVEEANGVRDKLTTAAVGAVEVEKELATALLPYMSSWQTTVAWGPHIEQEMDAYVKGKGMSIVTGACSTFRQDFHQSVEQFCLPSNRDVALIEAHVETANPR